MKNHFIGWYYKHSNPRESLAVIPCKTAEHAYIWVITPGGSYHVKYPLSQFSRRGHVVSIGRNQFSPQGIRLNIHCKKFTLTGQLTYHQPRPIRGNIMGPFNWLPMECKHHIISMHHQVKGALTLNGREIDFTNGHGYIESDRGRSFPEKYAWVQCNNFDMDKGAAITLAVATIPMLWGQFNGCFALLQCNGKEIRLATYKGAKIKRVTKKTILITQGAYSLFVKIRPKRGKKLPAPKDGVMSRYIKENLQTQGEFILLKGKDCIFYGTSKFVSWEYEG